MTASDLAQSTMAAQALQLSLQQSILGMSGIKAAQVFLALPADTPFLADQPKPTASVVIEADDAAAQAQGAGDCESRGRRRAGVERGTGDRGNDRRRYGVSAGDGMQTGTQFAVVGQVEAGATARIAGLLIPLVGSGNFQTGCFGRPGFHAGAYASDELWAGASGLA